MRPRRFGKSINLDMLRSFFDRNVDADRIFNGLKIKRKLPICMNSIKANILLFRLISPAYAFLR